MTTGLAPTKTTHAWIYPLILVTATLVAFGGLTLNEFVLLDDGQNIWENPRLNPPTMDGVVYYWRHSEYGLYIPVTYTVWGLLSLVARVSPDPLGVALNPAIFHMASIVAHAINVLVVFAILVHLISDRRAACGGALLFALHPVQAEPVAWAAGLKDVLAGTCALIAIWQYVKHAQEGGKARHYALATIAFVLAMLSKPSALVTPVIVLVIDWWLIRRTMRVILPRLLPWFALSAVCAFVGRIVQPAIGIVPPPLWARPLIAGDSLAFYLWKLVVPIHLCIDYGRRPADMMQVGFFYLTWLVPALVGFWLVVNRRRRAELLVAGLIFVAGVLPVLGFVTFLFQFYSTTADHYLYLSMLGPALAAAWAVRRLSAGTVTLVVAPTILVVLGILTVRQGGFWRNDFTLFGHAAEVNPRSFLSWNNLGHAHIIRGELAPAEEAFRKAIEADPDYPQAHGNLGLVYERNGELDKAIEERRRAVELYEQRPIEAQGDIANQRKALWEDLRLQSASRSSTTQSQ